MNIKLIEQVAAEHNIDADSLRKTIENEIAKVERKNTLESLTEEAERLTKTYKNQYMCLSDELEYIRIKKYITIEVKSMFLEMASLHMIPIQCLCLYMIKVCIDALGKIPLS